MDPELKYLLDSVRPHDFRPVMETIQRWASMGRVRLLLELCDVARTKAGSFGLNLEAANYITNLVEEDLAYSVGQVQAEAVVHLARHRADVQLSAHPRQMLMASRLVSRQSPATLEHVLLQHRDHDEDLVFLYLVVQEMVLRGHTELQFPIMRHYKVQALERQVDLAHLPLHLTSLETLIDLPHYSLRGSAFSSPFKVWADKGYRLPESLGPTFSLESIETGSRSSSDAFTGWEQSSNGRVEARVFKANATLGVGDLNASLLLSTGMECLEDAEKSGLALDCIDASHVFRMLFAAASQGGAYGGAMHGAHGRLLAWRTISSLAGTATENILETVEAAKRCTWMSFTANTKWFDKVAWDVGIICLRPDGCTLAILAATDTD